MELQLQVFLTSTVDGELLVLRSDRFTRGERAHCIHWIGDWVGPRTGVDAVQKSFYRD
jgi:hypothetical protein